MCFSFVFSSESIFGEAKFLYLLLRFIRYAHQQDTRIRLTSIASYLLKLKSVFLLVSFGMQIYIFLRKR